jgi:hypothetical protein
MVETEEGRPNRKSYSKPEVVTINLDPSETVLQICKTQGGVRGPNGWFNNCYWFIFRCNTISNT